MLPGIMGIAGFVSAPAITLVDTVGPSAFGTSHTFNGVKFGPEYSGRSLLVYIFGQTKASAANPVTVSITSWTVGGVSNLGGGANGFFFRHGGAGSTVFAGVLSAGFQPAGASGTVTFTTQISTQCSIVVISTPDLTTQLGDVDGGNAVATSTNTSIDVLSLSTVTSGGIVNDSGITTSFTNITKRTSFEHVAGYQCAVAFDYPIGPFTGRTYTFSTSGSARAIAIEANSWQ